MRFNLTIGGELSVEDSILIDELFNNFRIDFSKFIEKVVNLNNLNGIDLINSTISRNLFHTPLVELFLKLFLLNEKLSRKHDVHEVVIENNLLYEPVKELLNKNKIDAKIKIKNRFNLLSISKKIASNLFKSLFLILMNLRFKSLRKTKFKVSKEIILVDTFVFPNSFSNNGKFNDRYFNGFDKFLSFDEAERVAYAPTIFGLRGFSDVRKIVLGAEKSNENFIFQEEYLNTYDYLNSLLITIKNYRKLKLVPRFIGINIKGIFLSESKRDIFNPSLMTSLSRFFFSRYLSSSSLKINHVVDWNENQSLDKAFILGVKKFIKVKVYGYQGFISSLSEMHKFPEIFEYEKGVLPDKLFTISRLSLEQIKVFCPALEVFKAHALRFSNLQNLKIRKQRSKILVALPMDLFEARKIVQICIELFELPKFRNKIIVKNHPANQLSEILIKIPELKEYPFLLMENPIVDLYSDVKVLITSASSVAVEALFLNIPVAIYGSRTNATMNPIEGFNVPNSYVVFYNYDQLFDFIMSEKEIKVDKRDIFFWDNGESTKKMFGLVS